MSRWTSWLPSGSPAPLAPAKPAAQLGELRDRMVAMLHDCHGDTAERLRTRLKRAYSPQDLLLARCELYQLIARVHCESIAAERIRSLEAA
jgi:hypothetical protein